MHWSQLAIPLIRSFPKIKGRDKLLHSMAKTWPKGELLRCQLPDGHELMLDLSSEYEVGLWLGLIDGVEATLLDALIVPGGCYIDCGANLGSWSILAAKLAGKQGKVYAYEPNPDTYERLQANCALNAFHENIELRAKAVDSKPGQVNFLCDEKHFVSRIVDDPQKTSGNVVVREAVRLDEDLAELSRLDGIKIDVEGREPQVVQGAMGLIQKYLPWLSMEFHGGYNDHCQLGDWPAGKQLFELGYRCYLADSMTSAEPLLLNLEHTVQGVFDDVVFIHPDCAGQLGDKFSK